MLTAHHKKDEELLKFLVFFFAATELIKEVLKLYKTNFTNKSSQTLQTNLNSVLQSNKKYDIINTSHHLNNKNNLQGCIIPFFQPCYISVEILYRNNRLKSRL